MGEVVRLDAITAEQAAELFCEKCLKPRHADWVRRMATSPAHPSVARVIELSVCSQYQLDDTKGGLHNGGGTVKARDFQGV